MSYTYDKSALDPRKQTFVVVAGYMGDCCTEVHTRMKLIDATWSGEALAKFNKFMRRKGYFFDKDPLCFALNGLSSTLRRAIGYQTLRKNKAQDKVRS